MRLGIISTYPPIECGIATYSQYLTEALRKSQADVYVVSHMGGAGPKVFPCFDYEDGDLAEKAFSMMVRLTPDVVHIQHEFGLFGKHLGIAVISLIMKFRLVGIPVVTTLHTVYSEIPQNHQIIFEAIFSNSDRVIVHEPYQEQSLRSGLREELAGKICVIPHGAREMEVVPDAKERLGLPLNKKIILIIGYIRPSKNFELVIDIFPEILRHFPDAVLVIAGKVRGSEHIEYRNMLFHKIAHSPVSDQIYRIRGQLPQHVFDTIISAADVVALPYKISSQSGILAHCLALGKPIVTSKTEAMEQALEASGNGMVCSDHAQFIENIVRILVDDQLSRKLSQNAEKYVREVVSWSRVAEQHLNIYKAVMDMPNVESNIIMVE